MKKFPLHWGIPLGCLLLSGSFATSASAASSWDGKSNVQYVIDVEPDRPDAIYHKGETVTFNIDVQDNKQPAANTSVDWVISKDGVAPFQKGTLVIQDGKGSVTGTLSEPGFLRCEVSLKQDKTTIMAPAEAAIDPQEIKPSLPVPDDFDAFWAAKKKALEAIPINPKLTPVTTPPLWPNAETFDFQADCIGKPARGYYSRPKDAKPKSCPILLYVEGAGVRSAEIGVAARFAQKGFLSMDLNAHGIDNGQPKPYYDALANGELKNYKTDGRESRDTYYFVGMYLRDLRALDFLCSQPEWDGHTVILEGVSQGGAQSIAVTALDPRVTYLVCGFPGLCDLSGAVAGRIAGWPRMVPVDAQGKPDPAALETSRYVDIVNLASRVKAPSHFWIGFVDAVTPPTTTYAAYNVMGGDKHVHNDPRNGHGHDNPQFWQTAGTMIVDEAAAEQAKAKLKAQ